VKNKAVGVQVPTEKQVQALIADIAAIEKRIEGFTISLTTAQRTQTTKMRPGGEDVVAAVSNLAAEHGLDMPSVNTDDMAANLTLAKRLRPLAQATRQLLGRLDDTVTNAQSKCWWGATALYTGLGRVAAANPKLQLALQPIVTFFAIGKRKKGPGTPGTPGTPSVPPVKSAA
jgi:hypothetical protein